MKQITGLLIDVKANAVSVETIDDHLHSYYELLQTDLIDIQTRAIGYRKKTPYAIVCDDEGLLKSEPKISAIDSVGRIMFVGNLFIVKNGEDGELASLEKNDVDYLSRFIRMQGTARFPDPYPMLHQVEYL